MIILENDTLKVTVNPKGAELTSIFHKQKLLEYMWQADPAFWGKHSPVLFPIVGTLKGDTYNYKGESYHLGRHGFAREMTFSVEEQTKSSAVCSLSATEETLQKYPFAFRVTITYSITDAQLQITYKVYNDGDEPMFFSVGGHPAFKVPLAENTVYEDYYLEFDQEEDAGRWPISKDGLIELHPEPMLNKTSKLPLTKTLFQSDALVFKHLKSSTIKLKSDKTAEGFTFHFPGFPYLGIWAAKNADFVCIEPWCGIADSVNSTQDFTKKEGTEELSSQAFFERTWSVHLF
jgi:galactose mutarotase-like enzyme